MFFEVKWQPMNLLPKNTMDNNIYIFMQDEEETLKGTYHFVWSNNQWITGVKYKPQDRKGWCWPEEWQRAVKAARIEFDRQSNEEHDDGYNLRPLPPNFL